MSASKSLVSKWSQYITLQKWTWTQLIDPVQSLRLRGVLASIYNTASFPEKYKDFTIPAKILPAGFHFVYHNPNLDNLGLDGYDNYQAPLDLESNRGVFKRRMWVSGTIDFVGPIYFGSEIECSERITGVRNLGSGCFVTIERKFSDKTTGGTTLIETRTLAYTNSKYQPLHTKTGSVKRSGTEPNSEQSDKLIILQVDNFRFSSLTYNAHKIHYDINYCRNEEGLPNVLVSGPLSVTVILDWWSKIQPGLRVESIKYKNRLPLFQGDVVQIKCIKKSGTAHDIRIEDSRGILVEANIASTYAEATD